jgi:hypothetical protein
MESTIPEFLGEDLVHIFERVIDKCPAGSTTHRDMIRRGTMGLLVELEDKFDRWQANYEAQQGLTDADGDDAVRAARELWSAPKK